jgi:hypothetical protein
MYHGSQVQEEASITMLLPAGQDLTQLLGNDENVEEGSDLGEGDSDAVWPDWANFRSTTNSLLLHLKSYRSSPKYWATVFQSIHYILISQKGAVLYFGRFFLKLIWSEQNSAARHGFETTAKKNSRNRFQVALLGLAIATTLRRLSLLAISSCFFSSSGRRILLSGRGDGPVEAQLRVLRVRHAHAGGDAQGVNFMNRPDRPLTYIK